jgi:hypothetical protein
VQGTQTPTSRQCSTIYKHIRTLIIFKTCLRHLGKWSLVQRCHSISVLPFFTVSRPNQNRPKNQEKDGRPSYHRGRSSRSRRRGSSRRGWRRRRWRARAAAARVNRAPCARAGGDGPAVAADPAAGDHAQDQKGAPCACVCRRGSACVCVCLCPALATHSAHSSPRPSPQKTHNSGK